MVNLPIEQRILHYFLAMGAQQNPTKDNDEASLSFSLGTEKIVVSILTLEDLVQRNRILNALLRLASLRSLANQLYVAAPKLLGASLDANIFRSQGIGLLLFDERRIEETIQPQAISSSARPEQLTPTLDPAMLSELAALKSMYAEMKKRIEDIHAEFKSLKNNPLQQSEQAPCLDNLVFEPIQRAAALHSAKSFEESSLPSFFTNNPWIDVLSKRGRSEVAPLAG